jgi:hypothetical protein
MARKLRIQFEGAIYHVINRGNYRQDVFGSVGAAMAFEATLAEAGSEKRGRAVGFGVDGDGGVAGVLRWRAG